MPLTALDNLRGLSYLEWYIQLRISPTNILLLMELPTSHTKSSARIPMAIIRALLASLLCPRERVVEVEAIEIID